MEIELKKEEFARRIFDFYLGRREFSRDEITAYAIAFAGSVKNVDTDKIGSVNVCYEPIPAGEGSANPSNKITVSGDSLMSVRCFANDLDTIWHEFGHIVDFGEIRSGSEKALETVYIYNVCAPLFVSAFCEVNKYGLNPRLKRICESRYGDSEKRNGAGDGFAFKNAFAIRKIDNAVSTVSKFLESMYYTSGAERNARDFASDVAYEFINCLNGLNLTQKESAKLLELAMEVQNIEIEKESALNELNKMYTVKKNEFSDACRAVLDYYFKENSDGVCLFDSSDINTQVEMAEVASLCLFKVFNPLYARRVLNKYQTFSERQDLLVGRCEIGKRWIDRREKLEGNSKTGSVLIKAYNRARNLLDDIGFSLGLMEVLLYVSPIKWEEQDKFVLEKKFKTFSKKQIEFILSNRNAMNKSLNEKINVEEIMAEEKV